MTSESSFGRMWRTLSDKLQDQVWYQQGKAKWDELDARARMTIKYAALIGSAVLSVAVVGTSLYSVAAQKREIEEKLALIQKIQSAQDELKRMRDVTARFNGGADQAWGEFIQEKAAPAGISPESIQIVSEGVVSAGAPAPAAKPKGGKDLKEPAPASAPGPEETVVETSLKRINVRQLTKFVHEVENGGRTVKIRRLHVDTQPDESGYLDATVVVSAFRLKP